MADRTCTVAGCDRKHLARGYCMTHYHRMRDRGTTELQPRQPRPRLVRMCSVADCHSRARSLGYCEKHYTRFTRTGDPLATKTQSRGHGPDNPNWIGDDISYIGVHARLLRYRGPARNFSCADCGGPAMDWSYDHQDPHEKQGDKGPYSTDLDCYDPRCKRCHIRLDHRNERIRGADGRFGGVVA